MASIFPRLKTLLALAGILLVGLVIRLRALPNEAIPLNDGGYWFAFAESALNEGRWIPRGVDFNGSVTPVIYPPLGGVVLVAARALTGYDLFTLLHWIPLLYSMLIIVLTFACACRLYNRVELGLLTAAVLAVIPVGYRWFLMGGGVARGLGAVLLLLGVLLLVDREERKSSALLGGLALSGAILSHPVAGFLAVLIPPLAVASSQIAVRRGLVCSSIVTLGVLLWTVPVIVTAGFEPFVRAFSSGQIDKAPFGSAFLDSSNYGSLALLSIFGVIGFCRGLIACRSLAALLHLTLLFAAPLFIQCGFGFFSISLLVTDGIAWCAGVIRPLMTKERMLWQRAAIFMLVLMLLHQSLQSAERILGQSLSAQEFSALRAMPTREQDSTPALVVSDSFVSGDAVGEWFAALTRRESLLTHQMKEWSGERPSRERIQSLIESERGLCTGSGSTLRKLHSDLTNVSIIILRRSSLCPDLQVRCRGEFFAYCDPEQVNNSFLVR